MQIDARSFHLVKSYGYFYYFLFYQLSTNIRVDSKSLVKLLNVAVEMERLEHTHTKNAHRDNKRYEVRKKASSGGEKKSQSVEREKEKTIEVPF